MSFRYKIGERGSSAPSLVFESHGWLEVEEERKRKLLSREGRVESKKAELPPWREPCSPLLSLLYAKGSRLHEWREKEKVYACSTGGGWKLSPHATGLAALGSFWLRLPCVIACLGVTPSHASGRSNECLQHLAHAWEMRTQN
jgi:hypothetical protein